jgi:transposase
MKTEVQIDVQDLDHLGIIAGSEPVPINITHGYSRDHRPDLKQYTLTLLTTEAEGIPFFMQVGDGNELDQNAFVKMIKEFKSQWTEAKPEVDVMDAALNPDFAVPWIFLSSILFFVLNNLLNVGLAISEIK